ncbi:Histidine kinase-, DNA gyrase B-, and HSP90-like ATPase [Bacteroides luti]|uniref:Histidine kinase-, DNA gyrase B-, and HSP90-like ATPase n=1 Tax=Bacteroides luti TaxID=1297750 RepID=A0A1M4Y016_9BACE|nr:ATP-binding protein [Bacteroides luti]SHE99028.1 Histidine kinase-, DNA gyrase B-, and HSP90-like ATPase [Bacteroides luti]
MIANLTYYISEETPPKANAMINTFRAFGYNLQTAIADIIDNSISAKAGNVWIDYVWDGTNSWVTILDDGEGMSRCSLVNAMTPGSKDPNDERDENDLGRFGLGLKTSSFSQCKILTVASKAEDHVILKRCWDLDFVNQTGKWSLLDYISDESFLDKLSEMKSGTLVLWQNLDRLVGNSHKDNDAARNVFLEEFALVEEHLGLVFHRYLQKNKLKIFINGIQIQPWDPFMKEEYGGQLICTEVLDANNVTIKCYVLPHISNIDVEARKKAKTDDWYKLQGFYIYRNERLLLYGDWLGLFPKNEHYKNARILIDIPNKLDHLWKIDIKKATATPSVSIRKDLVRLGKMTRLAAANVYRFRGNQIMLDDSITSFDFQSVWKASKLRDGSVKYYINQDHPIIARLFNSDNIDKSDLKMLLNLIGNSTPIESIIQNYSENPESFELRSENSELEEGTISLARLMFDSLLQTGLSHDFALKQIFHIQPFNEYPQLIEYLK